MLWRERIDAPLPTRLFDPGPMALTMFDSSGIERVLIERALSQLDDRIERGQLVELYSAESGLVTGYWLGVQRGLLGGRDIVIAHTKDASLGSTLHVAPGNVREITVLHGPRPALWDDDELGFDEEVPVAA